MMELISEGMHSTLLESLKTNSNPVSIILDGSTSTDVVHFLVVLFQTLENNRPIVYFYLLNQLGVQETARALPTTLLDAFNKNGLMEYLEKNLAGFGSDGAKMNLGKDN